MCCSYVSFSQIIIIVDVLAYASVRVCVHAFEYVFLFQNIIKIMSKHDNDGSDYNDFLKKDRIIL